MKLEGQYAVLPYRSQSHLLDGCANQEARARPAFLASRCTALLVRS